MTLSRRAFFVGAAGFCAFLPAAGFAQQRLIVPRVDRLEILFVTDGSVFALAEPLRYPDLSVEHGGSFADPRDRLVAEWGLSLAVKSHRGSEQQTVLIDLGYSPETFSNNATLLGLVPAAVDAVVVSHGHLDHFGGMEWLLRDRMLRRGTPVRVGGEEAFCERRRGSGGALGFGMLDRSRIQEAGLKLEVAPEPRLLAGHGFTTGEIPHVTSERPVVPTRMRPGRGCERQHLHPLKRDAAEIIDDAIHELAVVYNLRDKGLVVIASCSHRGILNTIRQAQAVSGIDRVHAVVGGFHLVRPQTPEQAQATALEMRAIDPDYIVPGHCSGERFIAAAERLMPGKVVRPYVGSRFIFAAANQD